MIEFGTIVRFIVDQVEANKNPPDSEILRTIRLLKVYGALASSVKMPGLRQEERTHA